MPIKAWNKGAESDSKAMGQLRNVASLPFVFRHVAVMPDAHWGIGSTVGSVIPTKDAIIPAAVGVGIGCGMMAVRLDGVEADDLPDDLGLMRIAIEKAVPVGFGSHADNYRVPLPHEMTKSLVKWIVEKHPKLASKRKHSIEDIVLRQYGTLGGGNHFIEVCLDTEEGVWVMLHSGSRGIGNEIGRYFIELAKEDMRRDMINLPDENLAYLPDGTDHFDDYVWAVSWAQRYALLNRQRIMALVLGELEAFLPPFDSTVTAVNCHHNYVGCKNHFGQNIFVTRKGALRAGNGDLGIIPGSMGAKSYIVRGKGNRNSFTSCSHGAGRAMSRREAKKKISLHDHIAATTGVECRKDPGVIDESPAAYKDIDAVMAAQEDLVEVVYQLKQVICVKG